MKQFELHPALCRYDSCEQFCRELKIGPGDLILTVGAGDIYTAGEALVSEA